MRDFRLRVITDKHIYALIWAYIIFICDNSLTKKSRDLKPVLNGSLCDFTLIAVQF